MKIGRTLYACTRKQWRSWLSKHHASASEIWLIYYKKGSRRPRIAYHAAVEEALCYGWIDSIVKPIDAERFAQRFSPRRPKSRLSELNKERIRRLIKAKKMRRSGLAILERHLHPPRGTGGVHRVRTAALPQDILDAIKANADAWRHFRRLPAAYKRIRIGFIDASRNRPDFFRKRLSHFIAMTEKNKMFGMMR